MNGINIEHSNAGGYALIAHRETLKDHGLCKNSYTENDADLKSAICQCIADLLHFSDYMDYSVEKILAASKAVYEDEIIQIN